MKRIAVRKNPETLRIDRVLIYTADGERHLARDLQIDGPSVFRTGMDADLKAQCWVETEAPCRYTDEHGHVVDLVDG